MFISYICLFLYLSLFCHYQKFILICPPSNIVWPKHVVAANAYELNNLDNEALDAPIYTTVANGVGGDGGNHINYPHQYSMMGGASASSSHQHQQFTSLPCDTFLVACKNETDPMRRTERNVPTNPLYQSVKMNQRQPATQDNLPTNSNSDIVNEDGKYYIDVFFTLKLV